MNLHQMRFARLDREKLEKLTQLEAKLGSWIVALEPEVELAKLSAEELKELQAAEQELGVVLLAYKPAPATPPRRPRRRNRSAPTPG